jgi:hypothetical protein
MGRRLYLNGEPVDVSQDNITAGQLKDEFHFNPNSWVMADRGGNLSQLGDREVIPTNVERISIMPAFEYGKGIAGD